MISLRCPFHTFVIGAAASASAIYILKLLFTPKKAIDRFDVDTRFTDASKHGGLVFISGQIGEGSTIEEQTQSALNYVDEALKKAGTDKSRILEATIWLADIEKDYDGMNKVYDSWIVSGKPPCRACVQAQLAKKEWKVEVRVIAAAN